MGEVIFFCLGLEGWCLWVVFWWCGGVVFGGCCVEMIDVEVLRSIDFFFGGVGYHLILVDDSSSYVYKYNSVTSVFF